jgi:hypothetical protein
MSVDTRAVLFDGLLNGVWRRVKGKSMRQIQFTCDVCGKTATGTDYEKWWVVTASDEGFYTRQCRMDSITGTHVCGMDCMQKATTLEVEKITAAKVLERVTGDAGGKAQAAQIDNVSGAAYILQAAKLAQLTKEIMLAKEAKSTQEAKSTHALGISYQNCSKNPEGV